MTSAAPLLEEPNLIRRLSGEALGTALLLATVVGSGIMAERLTHDIALALLCNTLATGAMLFVLIVLFAGVSGAHFNPAVTLVHVLNRAIPFRVAAAYGLAQIAGGIAGVWLAHAMFGEAFFALGVEARSRLPQGLSEGRATVGVIITLSR